MRTHPSEIDREVRSETSPEESFFLSHVINALVSYRRAIVVSLAVIAFAELVLALAFYLLAPSTRVGRVPFRLEFAGSEKGIYPNSSKFSTTDVVASSVLTTVFRMNQLQRYTTFD